uniref:Uncharacterized protein n=1 Tax=Ascaris lumbricoides TaxID=6252 RepID=A0A0M3HHB3_ASCLU
MGSGTISWKSGDISRLPRTRVHDTIRAGTRESDIEVTRTQLEALLIGYLSLAACLGTFLNMQNLQV